MWTVDIDVGGTLTDGTMQAGERSAYDATIFNVESFFGWTIDSKQLCAALAAKGG